MSSRVPTSISLIAIALLAALPAFSQTRKPPAKAASPLAAAKLQLGKGDLKSAEDSVWKVLTSDPNNSDALLLLGMIRGEQRRYPEAEALFQRVVQRSPKSAAGHIYLGNTYVAENKFSEAIEEYRQARELEPENVEVKVSLAKLLASNGDFSAALTTLEAIPKPKFPAEAMPVEVGSLLALGRKDEALKLAAQAENSPAVDLALAEVFLSGKLPDQALNSLKKAAASGRRPPSRFYFIKAKALDATGNPSAALNNFQKAVGLEPNSEEYLLATAELYSRQNKHTESFELLQRAHAIDPNSLAVLRPFILEAVFAKKAEEALDAAQLLESESEKPEDLYVVASVLLQNKRDDEAVPLLEKYLSQVPGDTRAWVGLGIAYENNKRFADSQKAFERAIQTDPKNAQAEYQLGALVSDQGNSAPAIEHLERALQLNPNHGPALAKLGNLYLQAGQFEKARDSLRKAESLQPNNPETEYGLALAYGKLGDREEAKIHMDRFQQLRPGAPKKN